MSVLLSLLFLMTVWWGWSWLNKVLLHGDVFSPLNLLFYFWVAPFILCWANLSALQSGLEVNAIIVIVLCTGILVATCMVPVILRRLPCFNGAVMKGRHSFRINAFGVVCFYMLTLTALYFAEFNGRELPLVSYLLGWAGDSNLNVVGKDSKLQVLAFGIHAASVIVFYLYLNEVRFRQRLFYLLLSLLVIAVGILKTSKSDIFIPILSYTGLIYYHHRTRRLPQALRPYAARRLLHRFYKIGAAIIVLLLLSHITSIRLEGVGHIDGYADLIKFRYVEELGTFPSEIVSLVYGYAALGFQNFSNFINTHEMVFRVGTSLFRPVLSAFMMGDVADSMSVPVDSWNVVADAANTGTFLTPLYIEGGVYFCLFGSLFYGLLVNVVYFLADRSRRTGRALGWLFAYITLLYPWTWLFFTNAFSVLSIYINVFYVILLAWLFTKYRAEPENVTITFLGRAKQ